MTRATRVVIVDPQAHANWGNELLLELASEGGPCRGAVMRPSYCVEKACHCAELEFVVSPSDDSLAEVREDDERILRVLDDCVDESQTMRLRLELQIGKFSEVWLGDWTPDDLPGPEPEQGDLLRSKGVSDEVTEWLHALEGCFDGETLDELWRRHLLARGRDPRQLHRRLPQDYDGGNLYWSEVCPTARRDVYLGVDGTTVAHDDYCPNPTCTCRQAHVSFDKLEGRVGRVSVSFETGELRMIPAEGWSADELQAAWDAYVDRWPNYRSRLEERYERLRAALHNAMQRNVADFSSEPTPRRREAKVGRNAPCPCGSGRKYKRCCGRS